MEVMDVHGSEFKAYGRVIEGYDVNGLMKATESAPLSEGVVRVASMPGLEALSAARELADGIYGQMKIQVGYCNGHNRKLNALEYHRNSGVNLAVKDLVLFLDEQRDISGGFTCDTSKVRAFLVPAGTLIEMYATTLHYTSCEAGDEGFRCVMALPQGISMELGYRPMDRCGEEELLATRNEWLIGHEEGGLDEGAWIGLTEEDVSLL